MKKALYFVVILTVAISIPVLSNYSKRNNVKDVQTEVLVSRMIRSSILASGKLTHAEEVRLTSEEIGKVVNIYVKEGDSVEEMQLVLQIDDDAYVSIVEQKEAVVRIQESAIEGQLLRVENLKKQWKRKKTLFKKKLVNEDTFDTITYDLKLAQIELKSSQASLWQAKAQLRQSENSLSKTQVYSPINGVVTSLDIKVGETAISSTTNILGSSLMTIANPDSIYTEVNVDEADIANIEINQEAEIVAIAYPDQPIKGYVESIAGTAKVKKGRQGLSFSVKIRLTETGDIKLLPGMSCRAEIFTNTNREVTAVPIQAIRVENDADQNIKYFVYVTKNDVAQKVEVTTGVSDDEYQEIKSGVKTDDKIIIGPDKILRHLNQGDAVYISNRG